MSVAGVSQMAPQVTEVKINMAFLEAMGTSDRKERCFIQLSY